MQRGGSFAPFLVLCLVRWTALSATLLACASHPPEPEPGPAATGGWIEFNLRDAGIPAIPGGSFERPRCTIALAVGGRWLLDVELAPEGAAPPYRLVRTFRFDVPEGSHLTQLEYIGCRFAGRQEDMIQAELEVPVAAGATTRMSFDGRQLRWQGPYPYRPF